MFDISVTQCAVQIILTSCEFVTTALDRRSRKYFFNIILGMILSCGERTDSSWFRASDVGKDWQGWTTTRMILYGKQHEDSGFVCKCQNVQLRNTNNYLSCPNFKTSTSSGFGAV